MMKQCEEESKGNTASRSGSSQTISKQEHEEVKSMIGDIKQALTAAPTSLQDGLQDQMDAITDRVKNW